MSDVATLELPPAKRKVPIPREYVGQARLLIQRIRDQDKLLHESLTRAFAPIRARVVANKVGQRIEVLTESAGIMNSLPNFGLLMHTQDFDRQHKTLDDWRLQITAGSYSCSAWEDAHNEWAIMVTAVTLKTQKRNAGLYTDTLVLLSMHTLARWMQRSFKTDDATLFVDLCNMALHYDELIEMTKPLPHRWHYNTPNGRWVGDAVRDGPRVALACNSFHSSDFYQE